VPPVLGGGEQDAKHILLKCSATKSGGKMCEQQMAEYKRGFSI
jgi:hypothetical protein